MEQLHPYNSKQTKITCPLSNQAVRLYKKRRKGSLTALLFCIVDFINAFRILCPSRSTCQKAGANPMLKTRIKWDGCHETVTASAENTALPTVLTFQHRWPSEIETVQSPWWKAQENRLLVKIFKVKKTPHPLLLCTQRTKLQWKVQTLLNFFQRQSKYNLTIFTVQSTASFIAAQQNKNPPTFHQINCSID